MTHPVLNFIISIVGDYYDLLYANDNYVIGMRIGLRIRISATHTHSLYIEYIFSGFNYVLKCSRSEKMGFYFTLIGTHLSVVSVQKYATRVGLQLSINLFLRTLTL